MANWREDGHSIEFHDLYDDDGVQCRDTTFHCPFWNEAGHDECQFVCFCWQEEDTPGPIFGSTAEYACDHAKPDCEYCAGTGRMKETCIFKEWIDNTGVEDCWWISGTDWTLRSELWQAIPIGDHKVKWYYYASGPDYYGEYDAELEWAFADEKLVEVPEGELRRRVEAKRASLEVA